MRTSGDEEYMLGDELINILDMLGRVMSLQRVLYMTDWYRMLRHNSLHYIFSGNAFLDCDLDELQLRVHATKLQPPSWMESANMPEIVMMRELILNRTGTIQGALAEVEASLWPSAFISPWTQGIQFL